MCAGWDPGPARITTASLTAITAGCAVALAYVLTRITH